MNRDDIIRMAREAELEEWVIVDHWDELEHFAALVAAAEREACADECVKQAIGGGFAADCAAAIRARGQA
jgi:hypothetical protein